MSCSACKQRKAGRIVPVNPAKPKVVERQGTNPMTEKGNTLRQRLRFTGR